MEHRLKGNLRSSISSTSVGMTSWTALTHTLMLPNPEPGSKTLDLYFKPCWDALQSNPNIDGCFLRSYLSITRVHSNSKQQSNDPISSPWTKLGPAQTKKSSRSRFIRIYVTTGKKRLLQLLFHTDGLFIMTAIQLLKSLDCCLLVRVLAWL